MSEKLKLEYWMDNFVNEIKEIALQLKKINEMAYFQYK